jgi:hypothetical protein
MELHAERVHADTMTWKWASGLKSGLKSGLDREATRAQEADRHWAALSSATRLAAAAPRRRKPVFLARRGAR